MPVTLRFRTLAVATVAGSLSMGVLTACADAAGATSDLAPVGTTTGPVAGGAPRVVPTGAPAGPPRAAPPIWPGATGGGLSVVPLRGVGAGGGSTAGVEDLGLFAAGAAALAGSGVLAATARRRRGEA